MGLFGNDKVALTLINLLTVVAGPSSLDSLLSVHFSKGLLYVRMYGRVAQSPLSAFKGARMSDNGDCGVLVRAGS